MKITSLPGGIAQLADSIVGQPAKNAERAARELRRVKTIKTSAPQMLTL
jgi:hypothetical protein